MKKETDETDNRDESPERDKRLMNPETPDNKPFTPDSNERIIRADED